MAQQMQIILEDDLDGTEAEGTVRFTFEGRDYEIDLSAKNREQLAKALEPYVQAGRKVSSGSPRRTAAASRPGRHDQSAVREWARSQGLKVSERGRIPADIIVKYQAAH